MKACIEVKDRAEKENIERAMADPQVRAFVVITGVLLPLTEGGRRRVIEFISDHLQEERCARLRIEQENPPC